MNATPLITATTHVCHCTIMYNSMARNLLYFSRRNHISHRTVIDISAKYCISWRNRPTYLTSSLFHFHIILL